MHLIRKLIPNNDSEFIAANNDSPPHCFGRDPQIQSKTAVYATYFFYITPVRQPAGGLNARTCCRTNGTSMWVKYS